jgi:hypothetical protein
VKLPDGVERIATAVDIGTVEIGLDAGDPM